jgi:nucleoside 2-deoxyribosyltransferase
MRGNQIYLAGPITGQSYSGATEWRDVFAQRIKDYVNPSLKCISPMRGKHYLESLKEIPATDIKGLVSSGPAIVGRDHSDTTSSDLVVFNLLGAERISIGTMFEVAWAHTHQVPSILVIEEGTENVHSHSMLFSMVTYRVSTLEEAEFIIGSFFA